MKTSRICPLFAALLLATLPACHTPVHPILTPTPEGVEETTPVPTETPAPSVDPVAEIMETMTLREKVGQLFLVRLDSLDPGQTPQQAHGSGEGVTACTEELLERLMEYPVGGVALFGKNLESPDQLTRLNQELQTASDIPLFLAVDEEGGTVARLANHAAFSLPRYESAAAVGETGDPAAAWEMGRTIGGYLKDYGFNLDFAPVADVNTNPDNPIIGKRAFSSDASTAAEMAQAMAEGLREAGIVPTYKHFPGHGDTAEDSHTDLAYTYKTREEMAGCEWLPYVDLTEQDCVMVGHIAAPAVTGDDTPSSLSYELVTGILRQELGFEGLVLTDSLAMAAITDTYGSGQAAVLALQAGCDVLLMPYDLPAAFNAILDAVKTGELTRERIDESVRRILTVKLTVEE